MLSHHALLLTPPRRTCQAHDRVPGDLYDEEGRRPVHEEGESTMDWSDMSFMSDVSFMQVEGIVEYSQSAIFKGDSILRVEGNSVDRAHSVQSSNSGRSYSTTV